MNFNIHNARAVELSPVRELSTGAWVRDLIVTLRDGQTFTLTVFADERHSLLVEV